jgi:hypothetical protein
VLSLGVAFWVAVGVGSRGVLLGVGFKTTGVCVDVDEAWIVGTTGVEETVWPLGMTNHGEQAASILVVRQRESRMEINRWRIGKISLTG